MTIVEVIRKEVILRSENYKKQYEDYDFWQEHISLVVKNALELAKQYNADKEIVELGALLHDISLVSKVGTRANHHEDGAEIAAKLLKENNYPPDKIERVRGCVMHHRSSKSAENIEEVCVADADILAHFDNLPMILLVVFYGVKSDNFRKLTLEEAKQQIKTSLIKDYGDLSEGTKKQFAGRFKNIMRVLFGEMQG